jgi:hypothetical protein
VISGESPTSKTHDIVAVAAEGVKVITVEYSSLHTILKNGSPLYRKYLERKAYQEQAKMDRSLSGSEARSTATEKLLDDALKDLNVLELLNCNSAFRKLDAVQKRHLESLAEGPISFQPGERIWRAGTPVEKAFVIVSGTASFIPKRRNSASAPKDQKDDKLGGEETGVGETMRADADTAVKELGKRTSDAASMSSIETEENKSDDGNDKSVSFDAIFNRDRKANTTENSTSLADSHDFVKLQSGLQKRAEFLAQEGSVGDMSGLDSHDGDSYDTENEAQIDYTFTDETDTGARSRRASLIKRRSSRARFANKVLGRLYNRRAFTSGLVFSKGHFLGDVSKMVAGLLSSDGVTDEGPAYGFGDKVEGTEDNLLEITELIIHEQEGDHHILHTSTLTAGKDGCVVLVFPKLSLIPFLDEYPGLLLSLLGTQVVV